MLNKMLTRIIFVMLLISLIGMAWVKAETIAFACPTGYQYFYNRCIETELLKQLEELEK